MSCPNEVFEKKKTNVKIKYPCIVYNRDVSITQFAGNKPYRNTDKYLVTVIDRNPDSEIPKKVAALPMSIHNRFFIADNLNHDVFSLYF